VLSAACMAENETGSPGSSVGLGDIYRALFRYKWMILAFFAAGVAASAYIYLTHKPVYRSTAKLFVRYLTERVPVTPLSGSEKITDVTGFDSRGERILNTEIEILKSWDLAAKVVQALGPANIIGQSDGESSTNLATGALVKGINVESRNKSSVIFVSFAHPTPQTAPAVLKELIGQYQARHLEIHRDLGSFESLVKQTDELRSRLNETEEQLREEKNKAEIISVEDTKKELAERIALIRKALDEAEALIVERRAFTASAIREAKPSRSAVESNETVSVVSPPVEEIKLYRHVCERLSALRTEEFRLMLQFKPESPFVENIRRQIVDAEKQKSDLEEVSPGLLTVDAPRTGALTSLGSPVLPAIDPYQYQFGTDALAAKIKKLNEQLMDAKKEAADFDKVENKILQLQRTKDIDEKRFRYHVESLEQARIDAALDPSKMSNISIAQHPSPPVRDRSAVKKPLAIAFAAPIALGLGLALLLELFINQTVRSPREIESKLRLPLFLTVPDCRKGGRSKRQRALPTGGKQASDRSDAGSAEIAPWDSRHELRPFYEGLRDRILLHFEGVTRRPKLIGLAGCNPGSGATTLAAGLAAALSETGEGKVLLVDLNLDHGSAHPFFQGKPSCGLAESLEQEKRSDSLVQDNLFVASANAPNGDMHPVLSKKVVDLMPRLRASDFDYVIFDMPPISSTSSSFRLAGFMDQILLVMESGKSHRHAVQHAMSLLQHARMKVGVILNRHRSYVPRWLDPGS